MSGLTLKKLSASPLYVLLSFTLLFQVTVTIVSGQEENVPNEDSTQLSNGYQCVPSNKCRNFSTNSYIKPRRPLCPNKSDIWCYSTMILPDIQEENGRSEDPTQLSDGYQCVPSNKCRNFSTNSYIKPRRPLCPNESDIWCYSTMILPDIQEENGRSEDSTQLSNGYQCVPSNKCRNFSTNSYIEPRRPLCPNESDIWCYSTMILPDIQEENGRSEDPTQLSDGYQCVPSNKCRNFSTNSYINSRRPLCTNQSHIWCYSTMILPDIQEEDMLDQEITKAISELIPPTPPPPKLNNCTKYYLCRNMMNNTAQDNLMNPTTHEDVTSLNQNLCPNLLDVLCNEIISPDNVTTQDMLIWNTFPAPTRPPTPPSNSCTCVPNQFCRDKTYIGQIDIRTRNGPCPNYLDVCCEDPIKCTETPNISYNENQTICGHWNSAGVGFKITGHSNETEFGEFPWMMAILKLEANQSKTYLCGGSLIHPKVVLTAFHCVISQDPSDLVIRAGEWDSQTDNEPLPSQDSEVLKIIAHENYFHYDHLNDVALIIVTEPFKLRNNVGTLCLPSSNYVFDHKRCYASGWGKDVFGKSSKYQVILKKINLPVVPYKPCLRLLKKAISNLNSNDGQNFKLHKSFICAGGEVGNDTCEGDGGSPLMCPSENRPEQFLQAGIVSWGIGCGTETPGVYVNVALFRKWIDDKMTKEKLDKSYYDPDYVPGDDQEN